MKDKQKQIKRLKERLKLLEERVLSDARAGRLRQASFKVLCAEVMHRYVRNGFWSALELRFKRILLKYNIKHKIDYFHNLKLSNDKLNGYFSLDFYFPPIGGVGMAKVPLYKWMSQIEESKWSYDILLYGREAANLEFSPKMWHGKMGNSDTKDTRRERWLIKLGITPLSVSDCCDEHLLQLGDVIAHRFGRGTDKAGRVIHAQVL